MTFLKYVSNFRSERLLYETFGTDLQPKKVLIKKKKEHYYKTNTFLASLKIQKLVIINPKDFSLY